MTSIIGKWLFVGLIYNGSPLPLPNPNLKITYEFFSDQTNRLHYHREGEKGSCDRLAIYTFSGQEIYQQVTWAAPHNADFCSQDPDMQLGSESRTDATIKDGQFYLTVKMADESVVYVWDRVSSF
jgi:hypothetical protein